MIGFSVGRNAAHADKLDDFKEAAAKKGCESIPYSDLQSDCKSQQSEVKGWCDGGRGPVTCEIGVTADLQSKLEKERVLWTAVASPALCHRW